MEREHGEGAWGGQESVATIILESLSVSMTDML